MSDDWISPDHRPALPVPRTPSEPLWVLSKDHRIISCELRDESRSGAGFDLVIRQDGEFSFSRRCRDQATARYALTKRVAEIVKRSEAAKKRKTR
jgi:hypothetical protein